MADDDIKAVPLPGDGGLAQNHLLGPSNIQMDPSARRPRTSCGPSGALAKGDNSLRHAPLKDCEQEG